MRLNPARAAVAVVVLVLASCVDGEAPTGVGVPRTVSIGAVPSFNVVPSPAVVDALDRARVRLVDNATDSVIASAEDAITADQTEWAFDFTLDLEENQILDVRLEVELIDADPAVEIVEFAGRAAFQVQASFEPAERRLLRLGRGPLSNLDITGMSVSGGRSRVQEGASDELQVALSGVSEGRVFFESTDPTVASVDSSGYVRALVPGNTRIITSAGLFSDTLDVRVGQVNLPETHVLEARLQPTVEYVTEDEFVASFSDAGGAVALRDGIEALAGEILARRGFQAVGRFEDAQDLWEGYGESTDLRLLDGPQLGVVLLTLMHAADLLGIEFLGS
jgi:hypothetical protein